MVSLTADSTSSSFFLEKQCPWSAAQFADEEALALA
jgi:hypothetical protein